MCKQCTQKVWKIDDLWNFMYTLINLVIPIPIGNLYT